MLQTQKPYQEIEKEDFVIRIFSDTTSDLEFVWHRDQEDRFIQPLHSTDWKFQLDNQPPTTLSPDYLFIPKGMYHRLIKGTGILELKVIKCKI
jgi:hypothetical protein